MARGAYNYFPTTIVRKIPPLYATKDMPRGEIILWLRFFHVNTSQDWYIAELDPETGEMFGYSGNGYNSEWGYFDRGEIENLVVRGLKVERDLWFKPTKFKDLHKY